jgi:hypothetical protein
LRTQAIDANEVPMKAHALTAADQPALLIDLPDPKASFPLARVGDALAAFGAGTRGKLVLVVGRGA